jgi:ubiquinone/menaquinone biosynthesis C-methylase UbiE
MDINTQSNYIPALKYNWLTQFYDTLINTFLREKTFKSKLIESIKPGNPKHILDIGCGTATLSLMMERTFPEACVTGLDGDEKILAIAKQKMVETQSKIRLIQAMSYSIPASAGLFDVVTSSLMLHHLSPEGKEKTLKEVYRVLQSNGTIAIADWGKPSNFVMRGVFYLVQLLDGFETTTDNVNGKIPEYLTHAGFVEVNEIEKIDTILGTVSIYQGKKPKD